MLNNPKLLQTRREFLTTGIKGVGLIAAAGFVPSFLARTAAAAQPGKEQTILVVVQLGGGNDGLNTVIPLRDDEYFHLRPNIYIPPDQALRLNDDVGLNPALTTWKDLHDRGQLSIIQNVGYPNPDRSHFRSMEIWHTAAAPGESSPTEGWLGRYFDSQCAGIDPHNKKDVASIGMTFGKIVPQAFRNDSNVSLILDNPDTFQWNPSGETPALAKAQEAIFEAINRPGGAHSSRRMSMQNLGAVQGNEPETLEFLRHTAMNAVLSGDQIRRILSESSSKANYPNSALGQQLRMVASLIAGDMPTRVYYTHQGGYDTHSSQPYTHARLLEDLGSSVHAFLADLKRDNLDQQVIVMAFSEFGRRAAENASNGTDHGAAAPMFLFGPRSKPGVHGPNPDLQNLINGDIRYTTDFRSVYATLIDQWLGGDSKQVLGNAFDHIPIIT